MFTNALNLRRVGFRLEYKKRIPAPTRTTATATPTATAIITPVLDSEIEENTLM